MGYLLWYYHLDIYYMYTVYMYVYELLIAITTLLIVCIDICEL